MIPLIIIALLVIAGIYGRLRKNILNTKRVKVVVHE